MKKTWLTWLFLAILIGTIQAQSPPDSVLIMAYNQVLRDSWEGTHDPAPGKRKIYSEFFLADYLSPFNRQHFKVVQLRDLYARSKRLFVSRKSIPLYQVGHRIFQNSADTIDITLSEKVFTCVRRRQVQLSVACRGGMGYIPEARLIFEKNHWKIISFKTLYEAELDREMDQLRKSKERNRG